MEGQTARQTDINKPKDNVYFIDNIYLHINKHMYIHISQILTESSNGHKMI